MSTQESEREAIPNWHSSWGSTFQIGTQIEEVRRDKELAIETMTCAEMA